MLFVIIYHDMYIMNYLIYQQQCQGGGRINFYFSLFELVKFAKILRCIFVFSGVLTSHPARKFVMDFLRMIVVDSLSLPQSSRNAPVIDLILEVCRYFGKFKKKITRRLNSHCNTCIKNLWPCQSNIAVL